MDVSTIMIPEEINSIPHVRIMFKDILKALKEFNPGSIEEIEALENAINAINKLIPTQATENNKLADKDFVNSSIATNTATFKGTFQSTSSLPSTNVDINDYAFVITSDSDGNTLYNRYKYDGTVWVFEYTLNNSSFTAAQWAAIQSGITSTIVNNLNDSDKLIRSTSVRTIVTLTQAQYDALTTKDTNTEYNIIESV